MINMYQRIYTGDILKIVRSDLGVEAYAEYIDCDKIKVQRLSNISKTEMENYRFNSLRKELIRNKIITSDDFGKYIFNVDYIFHSLTEAACVILGRSSNGLESWSLESDYPGR